jgi:hypothetical protein
MTESGKFVLDEFLLSVNKDCFLVEVKERHGEERSARVEDLPGWIFFSEYALWLTDENKPIGERAQRGERVRKRLQRQFQLQAR